MAVETTFRVVSATSQTVSFAPGDVCRVSLECAKCGGIVASPTQQDRPFPTSCPICANGYAPVGMNPALALLKALRALSAQAPQDFNLRLEVTTAEQR